MSARIRTNWVDTTELEPKEQFAAWAIHGIASRYQFMAPGSFYAKGAFWNLGSAIVTSVEVDPFVSVRDRALIADRPCDHLQFVALLSGNVRFDTGKKVDECRAPCLFACDYTQEYNLTTDRSRIASVYIARSFLEETIGSISAHGLIPRSVESTFLASILATLGNVLPFAAATSAQFYARMLRDLISATIFDGVDADICLAEAGLRRRIESLVTAAPPGRIDVDALCQSQRIGRSTLYRIFRKDGGIATWDRTRRLRALYRDVANPADNRRLSEIGAAHGFFDSNGLARAFKSQFGVPASDVRQRARAGTVWDLDTGNGFERLKRSVGMLSTTARE